MFQLKIGCNTLKEGQLCISEVWEKFQQHIGSIDSPFSNSTKWSLLIFILLINNVKARDPIGSEN